MNETTSFPPAANIEELVLEGRLVSAFVIGADMGKAEISYGSDIHRGIRAVIAEWREAGNEG